FPPRRSSDLATRVGAGVGGEFWFPSISPDGTRIVCEYINGTAPHSILLFRLGTTSWFTWPDPPTGYSDYGPSFSADGTQVVWRRGLNTSPYTTTLMRASPEGLDPQ